MSTRGTALVGERPRAHAFALALAACAIAACGGGQTQGIAFDPAWTSDGGIAMAELQKRLLSVPIPIGANVAVGVVGGSTIQGLALDGGKRWEVSHALTGRLSVVGSVVVGIGGGELFAIDARTGKILWKRPGDCRLRGAGDDGKTTVVSLVSVGGRGSLVLAMAHDGTVLRQIEDEASIGVPAVVDGYVFLPWNGQYVTGYELSGGEEKARIVLGSPTSRAFTEGGALFFGEASATRFDGSIGLGASNRASTPTLPPRALPLAPRWMLSGLEPLPSTTVGQDKVRIYARTQPSGAAGFDADRFVATYGKLAIGFGAQTGQVAWAHRNDADFIGGAAYAGGVALCDEKGRVTSFDVRTGGIAGKASFGRPVDVCVVLADGLKEAPQPVMEPLAQQIVSSIESPEPELTMIQRFLLRELLTLPDASVGKGLAELVESDRVSPLLRNDARSAIALRRIGQRSEEVLRDLTTP